MGVNINTNPIIETAQTIRTLNGQLSTILENSQAEVHSLTGSFEGNAADATISAYDQFAAKYFDEYHKLIDDYVIFLEQQVAPSYEATDKKAEAMAENYKEGQI